MLMRILVASFLLVASMGSQAAIIEYADYKRDTSGACAVTETDCKYNIVTGGGLEWLKWDVTKGLSVDQALNAYAGWTLATNDQMAVLFNVFQFGKNNWNAYENNSQYYSTPWAAGEQSAHNRFMRLFGYTVRYDYNGKSRSDPLQYTSALFGSDGNKNGQFNETLIQDDYLEDGVFKNNAVAYLYADNETYQPPHDYRGVALVRKASVVPPTQVSLPGSLSLLALGLVALGFRRRKA